MRQNNYLLIQEIINILEDTKQEEINNEIVYKVKYGGRYLEFNATNMEFYERIPVKPAVYNQRGEPIFRNLLVFKCSLDEANNIVCEDPGNNRL